MSRLNRSFPTPRVLLGRGSKFYGPADVEAGTGVESLTQIDVSSFPTTFAPLTISPVGYGSLNIVWERPSVTWSELRLCRSSYGYPTSIYEGNLVLDHVYTGAPNSFTDTGLRQGKTYYYTLFMYLPGFAIWLNVGQGSYLVTYNYDTTGLLWEFTPTWFRQEDASYGNQLYRFLNLYGYEFDRLRSEVASLALIGNVDQLPGRLLPPLANELGLTYEPEMGMRQNRVLIQNAIHLYKVKGTKIGVEGIASAYTGFGASVAQGINLVLNNDDASFENSLGSWVATANCAVARFNTVGGASGTYAMRITGNASGDATAEFGTLNRPGTCIPITAGQTATASMYFYTPTTTKTTSLRANWFDITGALLSSSAYGAGVVDATNWTSRPFVTATAPASTAFMTVTARVQSITNTEVHYADGLQVEIAGSASTYESPRQVKLTLLAERVNRAVNPNFETNTTGWAGDNAGVARSTAQFYSGTASLAITATAPGDASALTATGASGMAVLPSEDYYVSAYFRPGTTVRNVHARIDWYTSGAAFISTSSGPSVTEVAGGWVRASAPLLAPATAAYGTFWGVVEAAGAGEVHYMDAVLVERSQQLLDYFDGSTTPNTDYFWEGAMNASPSHYYPRKSTKDQRLTAVLPDFIPDGVGFSLLYAVPAA